jgi:arylsulfatase A-like enzyme
VNAICLAIDRLHAGYLGAYGNTWIETPAFDRLAAQSFLFDQFLVDTPHLATLCRSYWQGLHALCPLPPDTRPALAGLLRQAGVRTVLLGDEPLVLRHSLAVEFDERLEIAAPRRKTTALAGNETHLAQCFDQIIERLQSAGSPFLLWCHLASLETVWDAPADFRKPYWEEGDPLPAESAEVPQRLLDEDRDADELRGFRLAYAGQVSLLDACLGALHEALDAHPAGEETLLMLTSPRGFPLGEHRRVGPCDEPLYGELVQVPLMVRLPGGAAAAGRSQALAEPADLWATLLDCWQIGHLPAAFGRSLMPLIREETSVWRDRLVVALQGGRRAIRTPAWYLRAGAEPELFVKPDDRWEVNNVAVRCQDAVEGLKAALAQYETAIVAGSVMDLPPLDAVLLEGLE